MEFLSRVRHIDRRQNIGGGMLTFILDMLSLLSLRGIYSQCLFSV